MGARAIDADALLRMPAILRDVPYGTSTLDRRVGTGGSVPNNRARPAKLSTIDDVFGPPSELVFQELPTFVYTDALHCDDCSRVDEPSLGATEPDIVPLTFDVSRTLDGAVIASAAFREACDRMEGIRFEAVVGADDRWIVRVDRIVRIDPFASHVRTGPVCETCDRPRYVTRSGPLRLESSEPLESGFSRTDLEFGDTADFGPSQPIRLRPDLLVDRGTARRLKSTGLLGIHLITQP